MDKKIDIKVLLSELFDCMTILYLIDEFTTNSVSGPRLGKILDFYLKIR